ncbi:MAG: UDP-N-acetylmuramoyl-L-alanyl-D-glutamate--2,6-diaminopimelate ligase [Actinomycetota bacterium]
MAPLPTEHRLSDLLPGVDAVEVRGDRSTTVRSLVYLSEGATDGSLFFCIPGGRLDGHDFATDAVERGARVLVVERPLPLEVTQVLVPTVRAAMGPISAAFHGRPAERLELVGVTGTSGKTTTTSLLEAVFRAAGWVPGVIGTTGVRIDGRPVPFPRTTPEAPDLHRMLAEMVDAGVEAAAMEVSSHGLHQHRVDGVRFAVAVFTNLSQDHLDYHASIEEYFEAKALLFTPERSERAVVNHDSAEGRRLAGRIPTSTFGIDDGADVRATDVTTSASGIAFRVDGMTFRSSLRGLFNVENCLAALATARALGVADEVTASALASIEGVPGRVEAVETGQPFLVLVDYSHTPDSLENVLRMARPLTAGRVIVVFGCGGDRDRAKRPLMGRAATANADLSIITSDNPRSEDPREIIGEIEPGARAGGGEYVVEPDRRAAIRLAMAGAAGGDVVVIAGKGHETYQEFADRTIDFDDRLVAREELSALGWAAP